MRHRLSDDALQTLLELEAEARDSAPWTDADHAAHAAWLDARAADNPERDVCTLTDWAVGAEWMTGATHDGAGVALTDGVEFPW